MTQTPPPQVWPTFGARDARALIKFLVDAFGFEETVVYGEGDRVDHAELSWPLGGGVMLGSSQVTAPGAFRAYVVCDDPDALFKRAAEHGDLRYLPGAPALTGAALAGRRLVQQRS